MCGCLPVGRQVQMINRFNEIKKQVKTGILRFEFTLHSIIILLPFSQSTPSKKIGIGWYW